MHYGCEARLKNRGGKEAEERERREDAVNEWRTEIIFTHDIIVYYFYYLPVKLLAMRLGWPPHRGCQSFPHNFTVSWVRRKLCRVYRCQPSQSTFILTVCAVKEIKQTSLVMRLKSE